MKSKIITLVVSALLNLAIEVSKLYRQNKEVK